MTCFLPLLLLSACTEYGMNKEEALPVDTGAALVPHVQVEPPTWDFGTLPIGTSATLEVTVSNVGAADLRVPKVEYNAASPELQLDRREDLNGPFPWILTPGASASLQVTYTPDDLAADQADATVYSNDPDAITAQATQKGNGADFTGFYTGWYVWDEGTPYETVSNPAHVVDHHGDEDLYWYEPSGAHGLMDSADPVGDFAVLRQYVLDHAGPPVVVTEPFDYDADSSLNTFELATFTYFLCDFYMPPSDDPGLYTIVSGSVDDGIQVMVNGEILGRIKLGESGSWPLSNAKVGQVNSLVVILVDDSMYDKYIFDLAFYRDGVLVAE